MQISFLWILLVVGGNESTRHLLSGSLQALLEWPDQRDRLIEDGALIAPAIEELLRWVSPVMQFRRRTAVRDTMLDGQTIGAGDKVALYYVSANRDEQVFSFPDRLDLARAPNHHLAFGVGPHFCLGAACRLEAAALLNTCGPILRDWNWPGLPVRLASNFMNGLKALPARFAPR